MTTFWVKSMDLKKLLIAFLFSIAAVGAHAAGCMKGAAVGAVAGHYVGKGHAVLGATGGCIAGRHMANRKAKEAAASSAVPAAPKT
jgi:hypothetical protein